MSQPSHTFKRLVLGLQPSRPDGAVRFGVEFANLLRLELLGLLLEDAGLRQLANMPFARELRPFGAGWQPIEPDRLSRELELAASSTERLFADAVRVLTTKHRFEVIRDPTPAAVASISRADDILMIAEPSSSADHATQQFSSFSQAALESASSVMFVPRHPVRSGGAVTALALSADDPSIEAAAAIAVATGAELIVVHIGKSGAREQDARLAATRFHPRVRSFTIDARALTDLSSFAHALGGIRVRLLTVTRGTMADEMARSIASLLRLPVLMIEPATASGIRSAEGSAAI